MSSAISSKANSRKGTIAGGSTIATTENTIVKAAAKSSSKTHSSNVKNETPSSSSNSINHATKPSHDESKITELDYVAEYDFFTNLKQEHMEKMNYEKKIADTQRRSKQREEQLKWRDDGKERYQTLEKKVGDIRFILRPHQLFREAMTALVDYSDQAWELRKQEPYHPVHRYFATTLLKVILYSPSTTMTSKRDSDVDVNGQQLVVASQSLISMPSSPSLPSINGKDSSTKLSPSSLSPSLSRSHAQEHIKRKTPRFGIKTNLVGLKMVVLKELRNYFRKPWHQHEYGYPFQEHPHELKIIRILFRIFMNYIPISAETREILRKMRYKHNRAVHKLNAIHQTQQACAMIDHCQSLQHYNPKGCTNCGVIFVGGSLEGAIPYVKSISRDTGVATLVTLEFELETLAKEEEIQLVLVDQLTKELTTFENEVVYIKVRTAIQFWWCFVLQFKRLKHSLQQLQHSLYYYRIRRLSQMKQEIDIWIKEPQPLDMNYFGDKYCDFLSELLEYVLLQQDQKEYRIKNFKIEFHRKLVEIVLEARERRYRELLRLMNLPKPEPPIKIKILRPLSPKRLICYRESCQMRTFLTQDRYEIHMNIHYEDDKIRIQKMEQSKKQRMIKDREERFMLENIHKSKMYLEDYLKNHNAEAEDEMQANDGNDSNTSERFSSSQVVVETQTSSTKKILVADPTLYCQPIGMRTPLFLKTLGKSNNNKKNNAGAHLTDIPSSPSSKRENDKESIHKTERNLMSWSSLPHRYNMYGLFNGATFTLELVSKHSSIEVSNNVKIDSAVTRVGTHESCELPIKLSGEIERLGKIGKIHCLIYHGVASIGHENDDEERHEERKKGLEQLTIVDNSSVYGCYVVGKDGAIKVPNKVSKGLTIFNGNLVCIGVMKDGPPRLPVTEASLACIVYRLQIHGL